MKSLRVNLRKVLDHSYSVLIGRGIFSLIPRELKKLGFESYMIITDSRVEKLYGRKLLKMILDAGLKAELISFPEGERSKNRRTKAIIEDRMFKLNFGRDGCVIALGGGVVGDLAGFISATYLRGISFVQLPTTVLAMADSSIGGKVGVDVRAGKNLLGTFYQPVAVYIDLDCLKSLAVRQFRAGLAEVVKSGVIKDAQLFDLLENHLEKVFSFGSDIFEEVIYRAIRVKKEVVEKDEKERELRKILNFGHTIGHSLEALSGYRILHGEAVSIGMVAESKIGQWLGFMKREDADRIKALLLGLGLPVKLKGALSRFLRKREGVNKFFFYIHRDKKVRRGRVEIVIPSRIGEVPERKGKYSVELDERLIFEVLEELCQ